MKTIDLKKELKAFYIEPIHKEWQDEYVGFLPDIDLFKSPALLIKKGLSNDFKVIAAVNSSEELIFTDSLLSVTDKEGNNLEILRNILGLLYNRLFSYYIVISGSSTGTEREQSHDDEKFDFPYVYHKEIVSYIKKIEENRMKYYHLLSPLPGTILDPKKDKEIRILEKEFTSLAKGLDALMYGIFELSSQEKALIDYVMDVTIPLITRKDNKKLFKETPEETLEQYAQLFIKHFKKYFSGPDNYFSVEIHVNKYVVGMNFIVTDTKPGGDICWKEDEDHIKVVENLTNLNFSEVSNRIFIRKDIKGFEKNSFYVIKPNQYKLWHKAIAYLDLNEFSNAVLDAGRRKFLE